MSLVAATTSPSQAKEPVRSDDHAPSLHQRLDSLERLARLRTEGLLTEQEFAAGKGLILAPPDQAFLVEVNPAEAELAKRSAPTLLERMFSWKFVPIGLVAGFALSFGAQPQETMRFFDQALKLVGA